MAGAKPKTHTAYGGLTAARLAVMADAKLKTHTAYGGLTAARLAITRAAFWNSRSIVGLALSQSKPFLCLSRVPFRLS